jgi:hypothetical protein
MKIGCTPLVILVVAVGCICSAAQQKSNSMTVAIPAMDKYSRKEMRVHHFLWNNWQRGRPATAEVTFWGIDAGEIYTVEMKPDSSARFVVREYVRHYQAPARGPEPTILVAEGVTLRRFRLRSGPFIVRLVTNDRKTVPLFEYLN